MAHSASSFVVIYHKPENVSGNRKGFAVSRKMFASFCNNAKKSRRTV
jgi:hypothetical protein